MSLIFQNDDNRCTGRIKEILCEAVENGSIISLIQKLAYLDSYGATAEDRSIQTFDVKIWPEFWSHSFALNFCSKIKQQSRPYMCGGLNYHGATNSWSVNT